MTTMADLMSKLEGKTLKFNRGDEVSGKIMVIGSGELVLDLGGKNEGIITKKEFSQEQLNNLKVGDQVKAFIISQDNDLGQITLSFHRSLINPKKSKDSKKWIKFTQYLNSNAKIKGQVMEQNKGGLVIDVDGVRGFLPGSHLSLGVLKAGEVIGKTLELKLIEINEADQRLVFSAHDKVSDEVTAKLASFNSGQQVKGQVVAVFPFGVFLDVQGMEGIIRGSDVSWEKEADPTKLVEVGQEIEVQVLGKDETLGRLNLSLRALSKDPFEDLVKDVVVDDVVSGTVTEVTSDGIRVALQGGLEGFIPSASVTVGNDYTVSQTTNFLVAGVDQRRRVITLAPFLTSTTGLIYR